MSGGAASDGEVSDGEVSGGGAPERLTPAGLHRAILRAAAALLA